MKKQEDSIRTRLVWAARLLLGYIAVVSVVAVVAQLIKKL